MHTWGFHQRLIEASRWYSRDDALEGVDIVRLALVVAERLDSDTVGGQRARQDLLAETHALLGSALRLASSYEEARREFNEAWRHAEMGNENPLTKGYILRLESSWMVDMGELEVAEAALEEALISYRELGDRSLEGRTLVKMASRLATRTLHAASSTSERRFLSSTPNASRESGSALNMTSRGSSRRRPKPMSHSGYSMRRGHCTNNSRMTSHSFDFTGSKARSPVARARRRKRRTSSASC